MSKETVAVSVAVFESVKVQAYRAHLEMIAVMARDMQSENLWLLAPEWQRRTYPFCISGMIQEMMDREKEEGRKADWLFWLEDDIIPESTIYATLRAAADPKDRPYIAALAYCRTKPYFPGIGNVVEVDGRRYIQQWKDAPKIGCYPVDRVSMCAVLFHRSLFDIVEQPWFDVEVNDATGIGPDAFWCSRLKASGIQPYLCCDAKVGHLGESPVITQEISEKWNAQRLAERP